MPHGYEGQGPEHSSARLERFLQLSAEENWIVANCSTPANYFHILRRQMHRSYRKPLILMTPKSLLRHPMCISNAEDFTDGCTFHRVLWDDAQKGNSDTKLKADDKIRRVVICSGKVYFDLLAERDARGIDDVYLLRLEQIYPIPGKALTAELSRFPECRYRLVSGRAEEPGRLVLRRTGAGNPADQDPRHAHPRHLCRPQGLGLARHGPRLPPQIRTNRAGRCRADHRLKELK